MVRKNITENSFDAQTLARELKDAGFEDFITENVILRVSKKKGITQWTKNDGYFESVREIQLILHSTKMALENLERNKGIRSAQISQASY